MNTRPGSSTARRGGFTLIEILAVAIIMSLLAGIAIPNFKKAIYKADAARVMADMSAIRLAVAEFFEDNGRYPAPGNWGQTPSDLAPYLGNMDFTYKDMEYRLWSGARTSFNVRYPAGHGVGGELQKFRRPGGDEGSILWTPVKTHFRLYCDARRRAC